MPQPDAPPRCPHAPEILRPLASPLRLRHVPYKAWLRPVCAIKSQQLRLPPLHVFSRVSFVRGKIDVGEVVLNARCPDSLLPWLHTPQKVAGVVHVKLVCVQSTPPVPFPCVMQHRVHHVRPQAPGKRSGHTSDHNHLFVSGSVVINQLPRSISAAIVENVDRIGPTQSTIESVAENISFIAGDADTTDGRHAVGEV
ncbi:hypothetical protein BH23GEM2_BH23GEM2_11840 [soil metagenome]